MPNVYDEVEDVSVEIPFFTLRNTRGQYIQLSDSGDYYLVVQPSKFTGSLNLTTYLGSIAAAFPEMQVLQSQARHPHVELSIDYLGKNCDLKFVFSSIRSALRRLIITGDKSIFVKVLTQPDHYRISMFHDSTNRNAGNPIYRYVQSDGKFVTGEVAGTLLTQLKGSTVPPEDHRSIIIAVSDALRQ